MRILFMGTPDFAAYSLRALCENNFNVVGVISQPDKQRNRGMKLLPTPVKEYALSQGLDVYQPETLKNKSLLPYLLEKQPDIIIVVAYGKILPNYILDFPKYGCVNIHASLLPKYRGAAPIQWCILNGEKVTGVTSMYMEEGLDTGDMILKKEVKILDDDTCETLHDKLAVAGANLLCETIEKIKTGDISPKKQNDDFSCYAPMLTKQMGLIDWNDKTVNIINKIRGLNPWPVAYSFLDGKRFKIYSAKPVDKSGSPGEVISNNGEIIVATGDGAIKIEELQFENKKRMTASEYLVGNSVEKGIVLGV